MNKKNKSIMNNIEKHTDKFLKDNGIEIKKRISYNEVPSDPYYMDMRFDDTGNIWKYSEKSEKLLKSVVKASKYLSEKQIQCLRMHFFEGLSLKKIGDELGISQSSVRMHIKRSIRRLKKMLLYKGGKNES